MSRFSYDAEERKVNAVLKMQEEALNTVPRADLKNADARIAASEALLAELGYALPERGILSSRPPRAVIIPSWGDVSEAALAEGTDCELEDLFTQDEITGNSRVIRELNDQYRQIHRLDLLDVTICSAAGLIAGIIDILLVGIPEKTKGEIEAGPLSDFVRAYFEKAFPDEDMEKLAGSSMSKVPYDAQDNRNTSVHVEGLSTYYHRLLSLGHDPVLGLLFGTVDILNGSMTTIDKTGNAVSQIMVNYADRRESDVFTALAKQLRHFASDVNTSMGLPAPFMGLFNLIQVGGVGEYERTVAEIVQEMYSEGYDFIHFCSMSVPTMIVEVVVRVAYALKKMGEGCSLKDSIPFSADRQKMPKLQTMLFVAHSAATAMNAGKVYFSGGNPMAVSYSQWLVFAKYSFQQAKWAFFEKPELQGGYVLSAVDAEFADLCRRVDASFIGLTDGGVVFL